MTSNRCFTISNSSGIYKETNKASIWETFKKAFRGRSSLQTLSCNFWTSAAMKTSCLVDREPGLPLSLPPSSTDVRLEVEDAELGRGLVGSLVTSEPGVLVSTCTTPKNVRTEHRRHQQCVCIRPYLIKELGISCIELQAELPKAVSQRR